MYDLMINPNGDLMFETSEQLKDSLQINFVTSKSNAISLNFYIDNLMDKEVGNGLMINFKVHKPLNNKTCREALGQDYYEQCIKIRLESALGTIKGNEDIGSRLDSFKHMFMDDPSLEKKLKGCIYDAIKDILPKAYITIKKNKTPYLDYSTGVTILIIDEDRIYEYSI